MTAPGSLPDSQTARQPRSWPDSSQGAQQLARRKLAAQQTIKFSGFCLGFLLFFASLAAVSE